MFINNLKTTKLPPIKNYSIGFSHTRIMFSSLNKGSSWVWIELTWIELTVL